MVCWYSSFWSHFDLVKQVRFRVFKIFFRIWHADVSWPPLELITFGSWSIGFPHFGTILTWWNRPNVQFPDIFVTMYGRNGPKFSMFISILWYPQKWKRQILAHEIYPVTERGYPWLLCSQTFFSCDQAALWTIQSLCLSVTPFWICSHHRVITKFSEVITNDKSDVHAKGQGQRSRSQRSWPHLAVSGP